MTAPVIEGGDAPLSLAEVRDWLRLGPADDDAPVAALIRAAANMCEAFTGQMLVIREVVEERDAVDRRIRLARQPVVAVEDVLLLAADAQPVALPPDEWTAVAAGDGATAVQLAAPRPGQRVRIRYRAGLADGANGIPEALRQGLLRLVQHWHFAGEGDLSLPAVVVALWTPWRRIGLGGGQ